MTESEKEYADELQRGIKGLVNDIDTDTKIGQKVIKMLHGFAYRGYVECLNSGAVYRRKGSVMDGSRENIARDLLDNDILDENNFSFDADSLLQCVSKIILEHLKDYLIISGNVL